MASVLVIYILDLHVISFNLNHLLCLIDHLPFYFRFLFCRLLFLILISFLIAQFARFLGDLVAKILLYFGIEFIMGFELVREENEFHQGLQFLQAFFLFCGKFN